MIPNINLAMASQCKHEWNSQQLCWQPKVDRWGQSSQAIINIAGDNNNIGGATAAQLRGSIAAQHIAHLLDKQSEAQRDQNTLKYRHQLKRELAFRPFIDILYQPTEQFRTPNVMTSLFAAVRKSNLVIFVKPQSKAVWDQTNLKALLAAVWGHVKDVSVVSRSLK